MAATVTIIETMRSLLYLPYYLAQAGKEWQRTGLEVESRLAPDAASAPRAVLAGEADLYIGGPARVMMNHRADRACPLICFGLIVARDPFVLVGATPNAGFTLADLKGLRVGVANEAPTPWLMLQHAMRKAGVEPDDIIRVPPASMGENIERLQDGAVDVIQTMEPFTHAALKAGGHIWYRGSAEGEIGFSSFVSTTGYAGENADLCRVLLRGLARSQSRLFAQAPEQTAHEVSSFFPHLDRGTLTHAITHYRAQDIWARHPQFSRSAYQSIGAVMESGGEITDPPPYSRTVKNTFLSKERLF